MGWIRALFSYAPIPFLGWSARTPSTRDCMTRARVVRGFWPARRVSWTVGVCMVISCRLIGHALPDARRTRKLPRSALPADHAVGGTTHTPALRANAREGCGRRGVFAGTPPRRATRSRAETNERIAMIIVALLVLAGLVAAAAGLAVEDRPHLKRIDVSPARQDHPGRETFRSANS